MLADHCTQKAVYEACRGYDSYGSALFEQGITIPCREVPAFVRKQGADGAVTIGKSTYWTPVQIQIGDRLNQRVVVSVCARVGVFGEMDGWEAWCL